MPDFVVTPSMFEQNIDELSPSVFSFNNEFIRKSKFLNLSSLLNFSPGIFLVQNGGPGTVTSLFSRGTESDHTAVFLNGRRLPTGSSGQYDLGQLSLANIDSVEMIRGDFSSLHGDGAIGGVVNIRSNSSLIGKYNFYNFEIGENNLYKKEFSYGTVNSNYNLSYGFNVLDYDGYNLDPNTPNKISAKHKNYSANLYFQNTANSSFKYDIQLFGYLSKLDVPGRSDFWYDWQSGVFNPNLVSSETNNTKAFLISPGADFLLNERSKLKMTYNFSKNKLRADNNQTFYNNRVFDEELNRLNTYIQYVFGNNASNFIIGFDLTQRDYDNFLLSNINTRNKLSYDNQSLYAQLYLDNKYSSSSKVNLRGSNYSNYFKDNLNGSFEYDYYGIEDLRLFFKLSKGESPPNFSNIFEAFNIPETSWHYDFTDNMLQLEEINSHELGFKKYFDDKKQEFGLIYFNSSINNLAETSGWPSYDYALADTNQQGFETYYTLDNKYFLLNLSYTYLDASVDNGLYFSSPRDTQLIRRPMHKLVFNLLYSYDEKTNISLSHLGAINREDKNPSVQRIEDVSLTRVVLNRNINDYSKIFLKIENLFNEEYVWTPGYRGMPRSMSLGLQCQF